MCWGGVPVWKLSKWIVIFVFFFLLFLPSIIDSGCNFFTQRFRWKASADGVSQMEKLFVSFLETIQDQWVVLCLLLSSSACLSPHLLPITVSPTPRRMRCPVCQPMFLRMERSSLCLRCHLMTAVRQGLALASKETSPGRQERTWGSSSNPLYMEGLHTRWQHILMHS